MSMHRNSKLRSILSYAIGFVLAICITTTACLLEVRIGMCLDGTISRNLTSSSYKNKAYEEFCSRAKDIFESQGISIVYENLFPKDEVYLEYLNYEKSALNGDAKSIDRDSLVKKIKSEVSSALNEYMKDNKDAPSEKRINELIDYNSNQISELYIKYMQPGFIYELKKSADDIEPMITIAILVAMIIGVVIVFMLFKMYKHIEKVEKYIISSIFGAAIANAAIMVLVFMRLDADKLGIADGAYKNFLSGYLTDMKMPCIVGVLVLFMIAGLMTYFGITTFGNKRKK